MTRPPEAGDRNICFNCGLITVYGADGDLRLLTDAEAQEVPDVARRAVALIRNRGRVR